MKQKLILLIMTTFALNMIHAEKAIEEQLATENVGQIADFAEKEVIKSLRNNKQKFIKRAIQAYNCKNHKKIKHQIALSDLTEDQKKFAKDVLEELYEQKKSQSAE